MSSWEGLSLKIVPLIFHNRTGHVQKPFGKREKEGTVIEIALSRALQTSFKSTTKSKRNVESATGKLIITLKSIYWFQYDWKFSLTSIKTAKNTKNSHTEVYTCACKFAENRTSWPVFFWDFYEIFQSSYSLIHFIPLVFFYTPWSLSNFTNIAFS